MTKMTKMDTHTCTADKTGAMLSIVRRQSNRQSSSSAVAVVVVVVKLESQIVLEGTRANRSDNNNRR